MRPELAARIVGRSLLNLGLGKPLCVSFEMTHSCPADCRHCDKGKIKKERGLMTLADYRRHSRELGMVVCQLSGGEPLLRKDLEDVARAIKRPGGLPLLVCVTNGWLLTEERYLSLMDAGVDLFSISLDFPDERHDEFRRLDGLYARLAAIVPYLAGKHRRGNIALNSALTQANFAAIPGLVAQAERWGVKIAFSAYSVLRTGDRGLCIDDDEDLALLRRHIDFLAEHHRRADTVITTPWVLENTYRFFAGGGHLGGCRAGIRYIVVRPDGYMNACSMFPDHRYRSQAEAVRDFDVRDRCDECYVAIRAGTERPLRQMIADSVGTYRQLWGRPRA